MQSRRLHEGRVNRVSLLGVLAGGVTLTASCMHVPGESSLLVATVKRDGDRCRVSVEGEQLTSGQLESMARGAKKRRAIVIYDTDTPYKCVGATVYSLQRGGVAVVDLAMWDGR